MKPTLQDVTCAHTNCIAKFISSSHSGAPLSCRRWGSELLDVQDLQAGSADDTATYTATDMMAPIVVQDKPADTQTSSALSQVSSDVSGKGMQAGLQSCLRQV